MGSEVGSAGMTPEQKAGIFAGAAFALVGLAVGMFRRRKKQKSPVRTTAERITENPSLKNLYATARESLEEARGRVDPKTIESAKKELARQREALPAAWQSDIEPAARDLAERALQTAQRVRSEGSERSREFAKRWEKDYAPRSREMASDAVAEADQIVATARKKATKLSEVARKEYLPKLAPMAAAISGTVSEKSEKLSSQFKDGKRPKVSLPKNLEKARPGRQQPGMLNRAGQGVKSFTGQVFMISFWGAALGAVVYYGLLDEERREKVRAFLTDAFDQVSELIEDFQDEDVFGEGETTERF